MSPEEREIGNKQVRWYLKKNITSKDKKIYDKVLDKVCNLEKSD
jgi:hypothetical protein